MRVNDLSLEISLVLLLAYVAHLVFSLYTHKQLFEGSPEERGKAAWGLRKSILVLLGSTALIAWVSEILVGSVEQAAATLGMTRVFIGVIVVAVVGNAAEHSTAVMMAMKNRMELSIGIAIGSSLQIALFVAPDTRGRQLLHGTAADGPGVYASGGSGDLPFSADQRSHRFGRRIQLARRCSAAGGVPDSGDRVFLPAGRRWRALGRRIEE